MPSLFWSIVPVIVATVLWHTLDASPVLWLYDGYHQMKQESSSSSSSWNVSVSVSSSSLANQTVWVTGASSGIGAAVVCELARSTNVRHIILSARRVERMQQVVQKCRSSSFSSPSPSPTFSIIPYDARNQNETTISTVVQQAIESSPDRVIDMLILNSGIYQVQPAWNTSAAYRDQLFRVNVQAPIDLSHALMTQNHWKERAAAAAAAAMVGERGHGRGHQIMHHNFHLVVVSSIMAKGPQSLSSTYGATKAALKSYFQSLSTEEGSWLTVSMILPGATATEMWNQVEQDETGDGTSTGGIDQNFNRTSKIQPDSGTCMTAPRVAQLLVRAIVATQELPFGLGWWCFWEVWISKPAGLVYGYLSHYTPTLFYFINHVVALARMEAWKEYHMDMLELPALIKTLLQVLLRNQLFLGL